MSFQGRSRISRIALCIAFCVAAGAWAQTEEKTAAPAAGKYRVTKSFDVGGDGGWDYLCFDTQGQRLFVTRGTHVMVLDPKTGKTIGDIPDTQGVHGVAFAYDLRRGFTSNGRANTATIFELKTLKVLGTVKTGENPDAIVYEPTTKRIFTLNGRSNDATVIDVATGTAVGKIELDGKPEFAVADGAGKLFVNLEDKSEIVVLDPKAMKVTARWPLSPGEEPSGLAIDVKNHRLFSVCGNKMMVVLDADTGKVIATPAIGDRPDAAAFDPGTGLAYSSNGDGTLTVIHEDSPGKFSVVQNVATAPGARTMALDLKTHNVYLPTAKFGPPAGPPTEGRRRGRPSIVPGSFRILVVGT